EQLDDLAADAAQVQDLIDLEHELREQRGDLPCPEAQPARLSRWSSVPGFPCQPTIPTTIPAATPAAAAAAPAAEERLDGYRLLAQLGKKGGQATKVHLAQDALGKHVTLKVYEDPDKAAQLRICREAAAAMLPPHPGLSRVNRAGAVGKTTYIEMEFVP